MRRAAAALALALAAGTAQARCPEVEVAFTPGDDIAALIVQRIAAARASVRVQAYLFTDGRIARALFAALKRGVAVEIVGDAAQHASGGLPWLASLRRAGAHVYLNGMQAASHNKIVIVDAESTRPAIITGSYNFTPAAQARNAENVVVLAGDRQLAQRYLANFRFHRDQSVPWR